MNGAPTPDLAQAAGAFAKAVALRPKSYAAHAAFGDVLAAQEKFDEAVAEYRARLQKGTAQRRGHEKLDEAIAEYREAVRLKPDFAEGYCSLGNALVERNQIDDGIIALRTSIRLNPNLATSHSDLGGALTARGDFDEAVTECREAIRLATEFALARLMLGCALRCRASCKMGWPRSAKAFGWTRIAPRFTPSCPGNSQPSGKTKKRRLRCSRLSVKIPPSPSARGTQQIVGTAWKHLGRGAASIAGRLNLRQCNIAQFRRS